MAKRQVFELSGQSCLFIIVRTGKVCRGPVAKDSTMPFCERHLQNHERLQEVIGEDTPIVPDDRQRMQAL